MNQAFLNDTEKRQKRWFKIFVETKEQNPCRKQTKKAQQREPGGASQKCRQKALTGKASQRLTEKGIGKVTILCTQGANHNKNYVRAEGSMGCSRTSGNKLAGRAQDCWVESREQTASSQRSFGPRGVTQGLRQLRKLLSGLKWVLEKGPAYKHAESKFLMVLLLLAFSR